jgi:hypothetical protein
MLINGKEELEQWKKIQNFVESYLKRDVTNELIPKVLIEVLEKQQKEIEELKAEKQILSNYKYMYEQARYSK